MTGADWMCENVDWLVKGHGYVHKSKREQLALLLTGLDEARARIAELQDERDRARKQSEDLAALCVDLQRDIAKLEGAVNDAGGLCECGHVRRVHGGVTGTCCWTIGCVCEAFKCAAKREATTGEVPR